MRAVEVRDGQLVAVRTGETAAKETVVLRSVAGPGVPHVLEADGERLVTTMAPPLVVRGLQPRELASVAAEVADVLARGHAAGVVHGPLEPAHLQGAPGAVLVAGWETAGPGAPHDDVAELGRLLERWAQGDTDLLALAHRALAPGPPTMAGMADALRALLGTRDRARRSRLKVPARPALVAGSVLAGLVPLALLLPRHPVPSLATAARPDRPRPRPTITTTSTTTPVVTSSETTLVHGDARWRVGRSGDVVVIGDWDCDRTETPAVLRPATGEVWSFPRWPVGDEPLTGTLVATVPGALGARVVPHDRCDRLTVVDAQGRSTTLL